MPKVSLTKPTAGSTGWGTNVNQNWTDVEDTFKLASYQREVFEIFAEFLNSLYCSPFTAANSGAGSAGDVNVTGEDRHPGIIQIETGTTTTGRGAIQTAFDCIRLGGGAAVFEAMIRVPILPSDDEGFTVRIGLGDSVSADFIDGVYFELTEANADWRCKTSNNSTQTDTGSGPIVQANTWTRLRIEIDAGGTEAKFYIDGFLAQTLTTNIPTDAGRETGIVASIIKSAGETEMTAQIDYVYAKIEITTAR